MKDLQGGLELDDLCATLMFSAGMGNFPQLFLSNFGNMISADTKSLIMSCYEGRTTWEPINWLSYANIKIFRLLHRFTFMGYCYERC